MISATRNYYQRKWFSWVRKRNHPGNPQILDSRNLYILPSRFGWAYAVIVMIFLIGAINYQINTIFLMTFLLAIVGMASAVEAHANLLNLSFKFVEAQDAEQGVPAKITIFIHANDKDRFAVYYGVDHKFEKCLDIIPSSGLQFILPVETTSRGYFSIPRIMLTSLFPFGLFTVWGYLYFEEYHYYVYPQAVNPGFWPAPYEDQYIAKRSIVGDEEFFDLKPVQNPWLEPRLISWKTVAKGQGWYHKRMSSNETDRWLFKLEDSPADNMEAKLQHLSYWLQTAEANGLIYGLELKGVISSFAHGPEHLQYCLRQLALYQ